MDRRGGDLREWLVVVAGRMRGWLGVVAGRVQRDRLRGVAHSPPTARQLAAARRAAWIALSLGVFAYLIVGANRPANPYLVPPYRPAAAAPGGFGTAYLTVKGSHVATSGTRSAPKRCALVASTPSQRSRGLAGQRSTHGYVGMVYEFPRLSTAVLSSRGILMPLSIAWFGAGGTYLGSYAMSPCPQGSAACPTYSAGRPFDLALEVPSGKLQALGITPGSSLLLGGPCTPL